MNGNIENNADRVVIQLTVRNHPGAMSHITGLFSRRAFNMEGILCGQIGDGSKSSIYLLVRNDEQLEQIIKQLSKLYDVFDVVLRKDYDYTVFTRLDELLKATC